MGQCFTSYSKVIPPVYLHSSSYIGGLYPGVVWGLFTLRLTLVTTLLPHMVNTNTHGFTGRCVDFTREELAGVTRVGI